MKQKLFWIVCLLVAIVIAVWGYKKYAVKPQQPAQQAASQPTSLGGQIYQQTSAQANPFQDSSNLNPIDSSYKNPFQ